MKESAASLFLLPTDDIAVREHVGPDVVCLSAVCCVVAAPQLGAIAALARTSRTLHGGIPHFRVALKHGRNFWGSSSIVRT